MKRLTDSLERDEIEGRTTLALLLDMVGSGKRVLELGCGGGGTSRALSAAGNRVVGIEIDGSRAEEARASCEEVVQADLDGRPLAELVPNRTFDVAIFENVLEYLRDPRAVLEETRRFLAPGGYAVLAIPNVAHVSIRLALLRGRFDTHGSNPFERSYLRFFTLKSIAELCFRAGYRIVEIERVKAPFASEGSPQILKPGDFDREIMREIESDPEHDTTQFVLRAAPLADDERLAALVAIAVEAELHLNDARSKLISVEDEARAIGRRAAELEERIAHEASARAVAEEAVAAQRARGDELAEHVRLANENARDYERRLEEVAALRGALERASGELADLREFIVSSRAAFDAEVARLLEVVRDSERRAESAREVAEEANRDRDAAFAAREAAEAGGRRLEGELSQAQIAAEARLGTIEDLRFELESESRNLRGVLADRERVRQAEAAHESAAGAFFSHVEAELARTRREIAHIDGLIRQVQNSKWWTVKRALGKARRIVATRLRR